MEAEYKDCTLPAKCFIIIVVAAVYFSGHVQVLRGFIKTPKRIKNSDPSDHRSVLDFASVHFKWALVQRGRRCFFFSASQSFNLLLWMLRCSQTMISGSVPEPRQWFQDRIRSVLNAELPEGLKVTDIQYWFLFRCVPCSQRRLQILWIVSLDYVL